MLNVEKTQKPKKRFNLSRKVWIFWKQFSNECFSLEITHFDQFYKFREFLYYAPMILDYFLNRGIEINILFNTPQ